MDGRFSNGRQGFQRLASTGCTESLADTVVERKGLLVRMTASLLVYVVRQIQLNSDKGEKLFAEVQSKVFTLAEERVLRTLVPTGIRTSLYFCANPKR